MIYTNFSTPRHHKHPSHQVPSRRVLSWIIYYNDFLLVTPVGTLLNYTDFCIVALFNMYHMITTVYHATLFAHTSFVLLNL